MVVRRRKKPTLREVTTYSARVLGEAQNHGHSITFDLTDGCVGLTQFDADSNRVTARVLLSPAQWRALVTFVRQR